MPFAARALAAPLAYAAPGLYEGAGDGEVLDALAFANLTGVLQMARRCRGAPPLRVPPPPPQPWCSVMRSSLSWACP